MRSLAISATDGWLGLSSKAVVRSVVMRDTPLICAMSRTNSGVKYTVSPLPPVPEGAAVRMYRSAGSTTLSHWVTESLKLATITVSATARLSDATTPLTATAALSRTRRARSTASMGSNWCATRALSWS